MNVHNFLPLFLDCLDRWETVPTEREFLSAYAKPQRKWLDPLFQDLKERMGRSFHSLLQELDWATYRAEASQLDPAREESRVVRHLAGVEGLLGVKLEGDVLLFGSFLTIDGYARFHRGKHCVYLGVDESHAKGKYLDVLMTHELTHVARESRASVWQGFGLDPEMTHDQFVASQPVVEHLFSEGFSCAVSEILVPGEDPWNYAYQSEDSLEKIHQHGPSVDRAVHSRLRKKKVSYREFYSRETYSPELPQFTHYVWAWQWVKGLIQARGGDARAVLGHCSKEYIEDALDFRLSADRGR